MGRERPAGQRAIMVSLTGCLPAGAGEPEKLIENKLPHSPVRLQSQ